MFGVGMGESAYRVDFWVLGLISISFWGKIRGEVEMTSLFYQKVYVERVEKMA